MKKTALLIALAMIFCVVFTSCGKPKPNSDGSVSSAGNPFDIENSGNENSTIGSYRLGLRDNQGDGSFTYNGESVRIPMFICGDEVKTEVGFLAFANGVAQNYEIQIDGKTIAENEQMHIFNLVPSETIEFDLLITPTSGNVGDKIGVYFAGILIPSYMPESENNPAFGVYHNALQMTPLTISIDKQPPNTDFSSLKNGALNTIPKEKLDEYKNADGTNELDYAPVFELSGNQNADKISGKGKTQLSFKAYGGDTALYRTTIYVNHKPVLVNGKNFLEYAIEKGKVTECKFEIDISSYERMNTIYAVSVPINQDYKKNYVLFNKTKSKLLINENKEPKDAQINAGSNGGQVSNIPASSLEPLSKALNSFSDKNDILLTLQNDIAVLTKKISVIDQSTGEILKQSKDFFEGRAFSALYPFEGGYAVAFTEIQEGAMTSIPPTNLIILDKNLAEKSRYNLSEILGANIPIHPQNIAISKNGSRVACAVGGKLLSCELSTKNISTVIDFSQNTVSGLIGIYNLKFCNDDKSIAFFGDEALSERASIPVFGMVDANGRNLKYYKNKDADTNHFILTNTFSFIDENNFPLGKNSNGRAYSIDFSTKSLKEYTFKDKNESQKAFVTPNGQKIVTVLEQNKNGSINYHYRVYDMMTMEIIKEWDSGFDVSTEKSFFYKFFISNETTAIAIYNLDGNDFAESYNF
ncbi:MAG: hypothetical protein RR998_04930 [Oscillospiraceae bacterium]